MNDYELVTADPLNAVFETCPTIPCKRKQIIFYEGHPATGIYCLCSGTAKVFKTGENGKSHILFFAGAGDILGVECVLEGEEFTASGEMLKEGRLVFIEKEKFVRIFRENLPFSLYIAEVLAKRVVSSQEERIYLAEGSVRERMAHVLAQLGSRYGICEAAGTLINLPLSREDFANMIGTTPGTVTRLLREFKEEKAISLRGKNILIHYKEYLEKAAHIL